MKTLLLSLSFACMAAGAALAQEQATETTAASQSETTLEQGDSATGLEKGTIRVGAGLAFGSKSGISDDGESGGVGLNFGGEYFLMDNISVAPSYTHFFKSEIEFSSGYNNDTYVSSVKNSELNVDGRYYFGEGNISFYGLLGLSLASGTAKVTNKETNRTLADASASEFGLNLGAGLMYPLNEKLNLNGQLKYNTPMKQIVLQAGVTIPVNISF
ncbi:outer membrane beta-barrel protein [Pontibacter anaerobius]|uniref:Outer membrane beta-barrel protein n=1 Tax=Pontibacter anaerobius TaxID=2993940 RepID=A0ABT3RHK4_9BACT|nr:outer membrane beta-barrel protein [Pontibacter anaerobius]MCX2741102.1 outer membrane beta-barrel protein [Pontibacter anaerobius]